MDLLLAAAEEALEQAQGIVELIHDAFLQRDDCVVRDRDVLRTNLRAALRDIAQADAVAVLQVLQAIRGVERVHLQGGDVYEEAWSDELVVHVVIAQDVAHVLAEEALDALAEFL